MQKEKTVKYYVYNHDYVREPWDEDGQPEFDTISEAYDYILEEMAHFADPFMIGNDERISAIVFQGVLYT